MTIVMVGDESVGKTSILRMYKEKKVHKKEHNRIGFDCI